MMAKPAAIDLTDAAHDETPGISQSSFRLLIENSADGMLVVDLAGAVLYANPAAAEIFGQPLEELLHVPLGRPVVWGDTAEITVRRQNRPSAEVEMRVVEIMWEGRSVLLASLRDVSARRAREEQLRQSQKLEAIGRLASGIVHDFNNLLAVIEAGLKLMQRRLGKTAEDPQIAPLIEEVLQRTHNGGALTQQLLAFARRQPLTPQRVDLNERIETLTGLLKKTLGRGIRIELALDPITEPAVIDADQLDIAVLNLAVNAKDAMGGKGTLTIETSNAMRGSKADLGEEADCFVRVTVRDTGHGMSKEVLARVFEPFFTTKGEGEGTGLGLSQVHGFVSQSGGHVRIESEVGEGTAVHLYLPRREHPPLNGETASPR